MKKIFFFFVLQVIISYTLFTLTTKKKLSDLENVPSLSKEVTNGPDKPLHIILLWTWPFHYQFQLNNCPQAFDALDCFFTVNRSFYSSAKAVVIHHRNVCNSKAQLPQIPRPPNQYWIWFNTESPSHSPNLNFMDNLINLTMSYRADSDIFTPYGWLEMKNESQNFTIPKKTKLVAWAITNWNGNSRRVQYYAELKKYINVDIFGRQRMPLSKSGLLDTMSKYKFYLAFENSIHQDYITEKLWTNSFLSGTVPVVMGPTRKNYERFIPSDSFIHVDDFPTAKDLASYLHELDKDDQRYQQYFNWRSMYQPTKKRRSWVIEYCKVCKAVKEAPVYRIIPSIGEWFK
ncbi:3-galactosyl-N-acetylglucosaminide 4-alpha-L-fucosyltransferase FUT3-like [Spea bombifrons]|uniref:3-galactosyl-N-acetylglucosaminide 4-alpha-L-fucosyltransferase FUT3-like n=1 Tax=Spea bombifrons TaxID=233779 RepID=UPI00234A30AE|nr:3-galactosyl-N-acetylglucosaminide 4-alpha-L-fucosyltransferase FUT3-like [Spea bombifrons]